MNHKRVYSLFVSAFTVALCLSGAAHAQGSFRFGNATVAVNDTSNAFDQLEGIAVDTSGNLYVAGCSIASNAGICKETLQPNGTYVESLLFSHTANGLSGANYVAVDSSGNVYIADVQNSRVLKETLSGSTYTQSIVTDFHGGLTFPNQIAVDSSGNVYVTDPNNKRVLKETLSGSTYTQTVVGTGLSLPLGVAVDSAGNVYIVDQNYVVNAFQGALLKETLSGSTYTQSIIVSNSPANWLEDSENVAVDANGKVYVTNSTGPGGYNGSEIVVAIPAAGGYLISDLSGPMDATSGGYPAGPWGIAVDTQNNVYATNGFGTVAEFSYPLINFGSVPLASTSSTVSIPFFTPAGYTGLNANLKSSAAATSTDSTGEFTDTGAGTCDTNGMHLYAKGETCTVTVTFTPQFVGLRKGAVNIVNGYGLILGTVYISGTGVGPQVAYNNAVQTTVTSGLATPRGVAIDGRGVLFVTDPGTAGNYFIETPSGSTYTQTKVGDSSTVLQGVAVDGSGNFYLADSNNQTVTAIAYLNGAVSGSSQLLAYTALGNGLNIPEGMTTDPRGNVYVADTGNNRVVEEMYVSGVTYGTPASFSQQLVVASGLSAPQAVAADGSGNIYIADTGNNRILLETPAALGTFTQSVLFSTGLSAPAGVAVDGLGNVFISDTGNKRVLKETLSSSTYTQSVLPLTGLVTPQGLTLDASESLYIADAGTGSVIKLAMGSTPALTFASTAIGSTSTDSPQTITFQNVGNAALTFPIPSTGTDPSISTNFTLNSVGATACPLLTTTSSTTATLAAGASCTLPISFTPTTSGPISGSIKVTDNALNVAGTIQTIPLSGTGTSASAPVAGLTSPLAFGTQVVNITSNSMTAVLSNTGNATLNISGITITGTNPTDFAVATTGTTCGSTLAQNSTCNIAVTFTPLSAASFTATLSVADNAAGSPQTATLTGTGTASAPIAGLAPSPVPFNTQAVNTTSTAQIVVLSNTGNATLNISGITITGTNPTDFAVATTGTTCGATLAQSSTCNIAVTFTPLSAVAFTATLSVADNATGTPQTATLTGTGTAPQALLAPTPVPFNTQAVNTTSTAQIVVLSNPGNATLNISGITITGTNAADFAVATTGTTCGTTLAQSATCNIAVTFTPLSAVAFTATLSVADNATGTPQTATLTGTGTAPQALLAPTPVPFNTQTVNTTSTAQIVMLSNPGNATLNISGITITGTNAADFAVATTGTTCGTTLAQSTTCNIAVTFTPLSAVTFTATLSVADNITGSPQTATLTGTGVALPAPQALLTPTAVPFNNQIVNTTAAAQVVVLSNPGNATLNISGITITGTNVADFAINTAGTTCGSTLAQSGTCNIAVTFTPLSIAAFTATLSVADNATGTPQTATLTGSGISASTADFAVAATTTTQTVAPGAAAQFSLNVSALNGTFGSAVTLTASGLPSGASASFSPASVTPGSASAPSVLSIQTPIFQAALTPPQRSHDASRIAWFALLAVPLFLLRRKNRSLRQLPKLVLILLISVMSLSSMIALSGCSGGYYGPPPQSYQVTITGTSGSTQHSTTVTLTVQ